MNFGRFVAFSVVVHLVLFASIFDIYFTSPLVHGTRSIKIDRRVERVARRLVLFVADGLRAETFFDKSTEKLAPFLRDVMKNYGTWGISHTHIPTESRPGHVALIAGFYEDVSAVMKGWKENPVEFDSVFNQSEETWSWGSPDILPMFAKGSSRDHVHINCYHSDTVSFAEEDSSKLDTWVFDRFREFLTDARSNNTQATKLQQDQIIFFLHLLGIDSNGHTHKPRSDKYLNNIKLVDRGISKVVRELDDFYGHDDKTAYIFTADHGMTDWGSHGAGHPSETLTPIVAWGAGVSTPTAVTKDHIFSEIDVEISRSWGLDHNYRYDVEQADVAALMSAILRLPYPVNSVGSLPVEYLSGNMVDRAQLMRLNAAQIAEQFSVKMENIQEHSSRAFFRPFQKLSQSDISKRDMEIQNLINDNNFPSAIKKSKELLDLALEGLQYYHTYDRTFLYFAVLSSFLGWIFVTILLGVKQVSVIESQAKKLSPITRPKIFGVGSLQFIFLGLLFVDLLLLTAIKSPWTYYIYCLLPIPIWWWIFEERFTAAAVFHALKNDTKLLKKLLLYFAGGMMGIWLLIGSFFYRRFLSPGLLAISVLPQLSSDRDNLLRADKIWMMLCWFVAVFPNLPTVGRSPNMGLVVLGGILGSAMCMILGFKYKILKLCNVVTYFLPIFSSCIVYYTFYQSGETGSVSFFIHVTSWIILCSSWFIPVIGSTAFHDRLVNIYLWQLSAYLLLCLSYDSLFCVALCALMHSWIHVEHSLVAYEQKGKHKDLMELDFQLSNISLGRTGEKREPNISDLRRSFMLVFFLVNAFFGVGNIASMNSFDVRVVLPFVTVFNPFIMGGLLAYKVLMPYLMVTCSFCGIALSTKMHLRTLCCMVMAISDVMAVHFVFMVKDYGSWLEIGTSISHFVIVMSMIVSLLLFFIAANFLTSFAPTKKCNA